MRQKVMTRLIVVSLTYFAGVSDATESDDASSKKAKDTPAPTTTANTDTTTPSTNATPTTTTTTNGSATNNASSTTATTKDIKDTATTAAAGATAASAATSAAQSSALSSSSSSSSSSTREELDERQKHQLKHRELFLSRQVDTLPATHIRGKCAVTLLNETESLLSYLNKDVSGGHFVWSRYLCATERREVWRCTCLVLLYVKV